VFFFQKNLSFAVAIYCDFFLRSTILSKQHYVGLRCYVNVLEFFIIKINEYRSMLWSLWIIYILFAENSKQI